MLQIRMESMDKPNVFRLVQVNNDLTIFDLDTVVSVAFEMIDDEDITFLSVRRHGKKNDEEISLYSEDDEYDSLEEEVGEWFTDLGDEMHYISDAGVDIKMTLEKIVDLEGLENEIIGGEGNLFSKRKKVDMDELNFLLKQSLLLEEMTDFEQLLTPDYQGLFEVADELKNLKPWEYFENGEIIALQLDDMTYFVSVMGAGGQEFGLMMYDEEEGYASLEAILSGKPLPEDFSYGMNALTVNYVDRDELDKHDYELTKECGFSFRGKKNWITFRTYDPGLAPDIPRFMDVELMKSMIAAMINVTHMRQSGWHYPSIMLNQFPAFRVEEDGEIEWVGILTVEKNKNYPIEFEINDIEIAQLKKKPKSSHQFEFDLFYMPYPVSENGERPIYPVLYMVADRGIGQIIGQDMLPFPKTTYMQQSIFWNVLKELPMKPAKFYVTKEMKQVLQPVAKLVGVELVVSQLPMLKEFKYMLGQQKPF